jgi:lipopolysaccharide export system protein LptA
MLLLCLLLPTLAQALSTDRNQPINIEADRLELDQSRHISTYSGHVQMRQGSLEIDAERIVFHFDANNQLLWLDIDGNPAEFRQTDDNGKPIQGSALRMKYDEPASLLDLHGQARFQSGQDIVESESISVNTETNALQAGHSSGDQRVRMSIQPKPANNE